VSEAGEHLELLKNAVRQSIAALTAVETDTVYRANELTKMLQAEIGERPNETLSLSVDAGASQLLYQARRISEDWADEEGVMFIIDDGGKDEGKRYPFWVEMNGLRESWAALNCHVIFFMLPHNYRMLLQVGDHLADWMPVKLRIMSEAEASHDQINDNADVSVFSENSLSHKEARQQISILESQLVKALQAGIEETILIRSYYLPMLEISVQLHDVHRAESLMQKISEIKIPISDLPKWYNLNIQFYLNLGNLITSKRWTKELLKFGINSNNIGLIAAAFELMGRIAHLQKKLNRAKIWYRKALRISSKYGTNKTNNNIGVIYYNLGTIAEQKSKLGEAEEMYIESLYYFKEESNMSGKGATYHGLGRIAKKRQLLPKAEKYCQKSLTIFKETEYEYAMIFPLFTLGEIAQEIKNYDEAEEYYQKALKIAKEKGDEQNANEISTILGILARLQDRLESSGEWLIKSIKAFENSNDPENAEKAKEEFQKTYAQASPNVQVNLKEMWDAAGLSEL